MKMIKTMFNIDFEKGESSILIIDIKKIKGAVQNIHDYL
jgi:hypothetical protein